MSPDSASKIVQIVPAQPGWVIESWDDHSNSVIASFPVAVWALRDDGRVVGLVPGGDGLEEQEIDHLNRYVRRSKSVENP
jgi:hypothetical protein